MKLSDGFPGGFPSDGLVEQLYARADADERAREEREQRRLLVIASSVRAGVEWAREVGLRADQFLVVSVPQDLQGKNGDAWRIALLSWPDADEALRERMQQAEYRRAAEQEREPRRVTTPLWDEYCFSKVRGLEVEQMKGRWTDYDGPGDTLRVRREAW